MVIVSSHGMGQSSVWRSVLSGNDGCVHTPPLDVVVLLAKCCSSEGFWALLPATPFASVCVNSTVTFLGSLLKGNAHTIALVPRNSRVAMISVIYGEDGVIN